MLTEEQIKENEKKFINYLLVVDPTVLDEKPEGEQNTLSFMQYLTAINYFRAPASAQYFKAYEGGLCEYALKFIENLGNLAFGFFPGKYSREDIIKVGLVKDLYRAEMYEQYDKNIKNESGQWEAIKAYRTKEQRPTFGDLGFSSYMIAKKFFDFTDEQIEAICNARPLDSHNPIDIHDILKSYPLVTLARMADLATIYLEENTNEGK